MRKLGEPQTLDMVKLLSELGSEDRMTLLLAIGRQKLKLTQLAGKISATIQETSRHAGRLSDARLIERNSKGYYEITAFGRSILNSLPSLDFLSKHMEYFLSHDTSILPVEFMSRIGELSGAEYREGISGVLRHVEEVMAEARQYVWLMADQAVVSAASLDQTFRGRDVSIRLLAPADKIRQQEDFRQVMQKTSYKLELRAANSVQVGIAMNEKIAGVGFPDLTGRIDFNRGFRGTDSNFHKWCHDLYGEYWNISKPQP